MAAINYAYVLDQLRWAQAAARRGQASPERIQAWHDILDGIAAGTLRIGSRAPIAGVPPWVTPVVRHGGFVTGGLAAEGPLDLRERARLERLGLPRDQGVLPLNLHHLSPAGQDELLERAAQGALRMRFPEQGALLAIAWLERAGAVDAAREVRAEVLPFLDRLRFTPDEGPPSTPTDTVRRWTAGQVADELERRLPQHAVEAMRETITVWRPLAERLVAHALAAQGETSPDWLREAAGLVAAYDDAAARHLRARRHHRRDETIGALIEHLRAALVGPLTPGQHRRLTEVAGRWCVRHGEPGSPRRAERRAREEASVAASSHARLADVLAARLRAGDPERGVDDVDALAAAVTPEEARTHGTRVGESIPGSILGSLRIAREASLETLVETGVLPSLDCVAEVLPQLIAPLAARAWEDPVCRTLIEQTVIAFGRRRSLLLVGLERQTRVEDLPWIAALRQHRPQRDLRTELDDGPTAAILDRVAALMLDRFPGRAMPNPLVSSLAGLTRDEPAELWPWTEELAADIFQGTFSDKFALAALWAVPLLSDTVYAAYYGVSYRQVRGFSGGAEFTAYTSRLARPGMRAPGSTAANGRWIEFAQVVTAHNMALLFGSHDRLARFVPRFPGAARAALLEAVRELCSDASTLHQRLRADRMGALAWRQGLFYLALVERAEQELIVAELAAEVEADDDVPPARWAPLRKQVQVLAGCVRGEAPPHGHVPLLGWS